MANKHGIFVLEEATALTVPQEANSAIQVVIGTAPVNMAEDPSATVNTPILATKASEAMAQLGYVGDFENYTLCQTMYITQSMYQVQPVIYINVLDPAKHNKGIENTDQVIPVVDKQAIVEQTGILKAGLSIVDQDDAPLTVDTDYSLSFDGKGNLVVTLIDGGAGESATGVKVSGKKLDPSMITKDDIIGMYDVQTGKETGMEVIRQVYPKLNMIPGILLAPGWSHIPEVGIALSAKAANINGVFKAVAYIDMDTEDTRKYTDLKEKKEECGFISEFAYLLWPMVRVGETIFHASAIAAARTAYLDGQNGDIPAVSPSNKPLTITGTCLKDGTDVSLDQDQATTVNEFGIATFINLNGYRIWGNKTAAYPGSGDPKDIWINVRRMFNWQGNTFINTYRSKVDDNMNRILIENIVDSENIRCAAYVPQAWAGAYIEYRSEDNPETDIIAGKMTFRQHISPYTPAETIENILSYDIEMLKAALGGE